MCKIYFSYSHQFMLINKQPSCERGIQLDIPDGSQYSSTPDEASGGTSSQQSNSYTGSALGSRKYSRMNRRSSKSILPGNSGANSGRNISGSGHVAIDMPGSSSEVEKYVHWCVDSSKTHLHDICVESKVEAKRGRAFIKEVVTSYKKLRGIRWWFSLTHCAEVKVVKVSPGKNASAQGTCINYSVLVLPNCRQYGACFMSARKDRRCQTPPRKRLRLRSAVPRQ